MTLNKKENLDNLAQEIFESIQNPENKSEDIISKLQDMLKNNLKKAYETIEINIKHCDLINKKFDNIMNSMKEKDINHENINQIKQDYQSILELNQTTKEKFVDVYKIIEKNKMLLDTMKIVENKIENTPSLLEKLNSGNKFNFSNLKDELKLYAELSHQNEFHILNFKGNETTYEKMIENITKSLNDFQNENMSTLFIDKKVLGEKILSLRKNNENNEKKNNL